MALSPGTGRPSSAGKSIAAYGQEFAGWQFITFAYDEHWHHRGQFTVYLRLCGITPLMIYDY
mgnify:CR=1 FL=1